MALNRSVTLEVETLFLSLKKTTAMTLTRSRLQIGLEIIGLKYKQLLYKINKIGIYVRTWL